MDVVMISNDDDSNVAKQLTWWSKTTTMKLPKDPWVPVKNDDDDGQLRGPSGHQYNTVQYNTLQYSTAQYGTGQYSAVQYSTVQYNQNSTVQYSTVQYSTLHYTTAPPARPPAR